MYFLFDEDQDLLRESARGLLGSVLPSTKIRELADSDTGFDPAAWRKGAELGLLSMLVAADHGGGSLTEQGLVDAVVLGEEVGRAIAPGPFVAANVVLFALSEYGSPSQQAHLPALVAGNELATWCFAEADADWDPSRLALTARPDAGDLILDGTKLYVESAAVADYFLVAARLDGRPVQILVPASTDGISVEGHRSLDITRRLDVVTFAGVRVPASSVLPGADAAALDRMLQVASVLTCADSIGGADVIVERTVAYTKEREQFGRKIASFQAIKHRCADLLALLESARVATHYAALAVQDSAADADVAVSVAKAFVGDAYATITGEGTQLHGGIGFAWEHDMHLFVRRSKANEVLYGSPAWHRRRTWAFLHTAAATNEKV